MCKRFLLHIITDIVVGMTTSQKAPCPIHHLHGDKHALFLETGRTYCLCQIPQPENCDHTAAVYGDPLTGQWQCASCGQIWVE